MKTRIRLITISELFITTEAVITSKKEHKNKEAVVGKIIIIENTPKITS